MIKNLAHAGIGMVAILVTGRLLAVPSIAASVHHSKYGHLAVIGLFAALALYTLASLAGAARSGKPARSRSSSRVSPYAAPGKRR